MDLDLETTTNSSTTLGPEPEVRDPYLATAEVATLAAMFVVAVSGNCITLAAILVRRGHHRKLSRMRYLIVHLCVADLLVAFFHILAQLLLDATERFAGGYPGDDALCRMVKFMQVLGPYLSADVLVATAIDRYLAIRFPLKARCCKLLVGVAWCLALVCSVPQLIVFSYTAIQFRPTVVYDCWATFSQQWAEKAYVTFYACAVFLFPFSLLLFTYLGICRAIWVNFRRKRNLTTITSNSTNNTTTNNNCAVSSSCAATAPADGARGNNPRTHSMRGISRAKMKTVKLTVVVILSYVACSMPYISAMLWLVWYPEARNTPFGRSAAFTILALLASLNSCANPWIYLCFNENVAQTLSDVICCRKCRNSSATNDHAALNVGVFSRSSLSDTAQRSTHVNMLVHGQG